jgi:hypothetical protein
MEAWLCASVRALPALLVAGCADPLPLEGRHCPCADGYQCCESGNICLPETQTCPTWKALDRDSLEAFGLDGAATGWDFDVGPDGTPYVVVLHCEVGDCWSPVRRVPDVFRYEDGSWTSLPSLGLPNTNGVTRLRVGRDGTPHLLMDVSPDESDERRWIIASFDGARWAERHAPISSAPSGIDPTGQFLEDNQGRLIVPVLEPSDLSAMFSVLRSDGFEWQTVSSPLVTTTAAVQLAERDGALCVTHHSASGSGTFLHCLEGSDWSPVRTFHELIGQGVWIGPDGSLYVVQTEFLESWVMRGKGDDWTEFPSVMSQGAAIEVTSGGRLFMLGLGHDFDSRVAVWDTERRAWSHFTTETYDAIPFEYVSYAKLVVGPNEATPYLAFQIFDEDYRTKFNVWKHE